MKINRIKSHRPFIAGKLALSSTLALLLLASASAAENWVAYLASANGSRVKIEGTSTLHDWTMESTLVAGKMELEEGFKLDSSLKPGKVNARVTVSMPVRQFKNGKYSGMDEVMQQAMKEDKSPKIEYKLTELVFKEAPKSADAPYSFDSTGELTVAGVTKKISMPITIFQVSPVRLKVAGTIGLKMTDYGVVPPAPKIAGGFIKTGDEVKISFDWVAAQRTAKP